ncbi:YihY/virulence factor BrkB family protein [Mucilaginibacter sp. RS28]|uniref:YihY/virulence factor BrkB family protein n=1 Tax=Mucilaginibacter straminoryzae TaxID=2932774 RepID=A0A9X1X7D3_9SPHI|nr:YihY/virulence factor BrkB family protein [Mucilaginibacter straminoryzae]MCJ8211775.1 YihY/virulence factor BrkB family protein [Mucilaginibacter straminoryzae]
MKFFSKENLNRWLCVLKATFSGFSNDNGLKLSASLAYYTVFSIAPLLILILSLAGIFLGPQATSASDSLYHQIDQYVGKEAAKQIQDVIKNLQFSGKSGIALISGIVTLLIGASSIFIEIQDSLNMIWRVKAKPKKGWLKMLQNRFISFSLIVSLGFLLLVSLLVNIIVNAISDKISHFLPVITERLIELINLGISFLVISTLFGIIFKFLPDVKIKWKDVRSGAFFTAILFMIGQFLISIYLRYSAQGSAYGAAGSIIVVLVWIYYTAAILYIGAEFTQVFAEANGSYLEPAEYAVHVKQEEVEMEVKKLPPQNPELHGKLKEN